MLTMFAIDKLLETITMKNKAPPTRKLQRSPKIVGYEREDDDYSEMSLEMKEPLLSTRDDKIIEYIDQEKNIKGVSNKKNSVRVKVLLTKEEATKLLTKCKEEGVLDFKDVVNELMKLPTQRIDVVSGITPSKDLELATIIEEEEEEEEYDEYYKKNI